MSKRRLIRAVHERDLDEFLTKAGLLVDLEKNRLTCVRCGRKLNKSNISKFIIKEGNISVLCDDPHCSNLVGEGNNAD